MDRHGATTDTEPSAPLPKVLALYRDLIDDAGNMVGWDTAFWALQCVDGPVVTIPVQPPVFASVWLTIDDACAELDVYVDRVEPRSVSRLWSDR